MTVLAINPNRFKPQIAPIGLEYVCNGLLHAGIDFKLVDLNFEPESCIDAHIKGGNIELAVLSIRNVDSAYFVHNEFFLPRIRRLVARIKNASDCRVALGGAGFSIFPREILQYTGADFGIVGFGETALAELVLALRNGREFAEIRNLVFSENGLIQINPVGKGEYAEVPSRRRDIVNNKAYFATSGMGNIETKRGCSMGCGYCVEPHIVGANVLHRPVAYVMDELRALLEQGIDYVHFCDSEFNVGNMDTIEALLHEMSSSRLPMRYTVFMHPRSALVTESLARLLAQSGCREVTFSVDSGSNEMLKALHKGHTSEDVAHSTDLIRRHGISVGHSYLLGNPGETTETIDRTIDLIKATEPDFALVYVGLRLYPHTAVTQAAIEEGWLKPDADLLIPQFYRPHHVLRELLPYVRKRARGIKNCVLPTSGVDLLNLACQQIYLDGFCGSFSEFVEHVNTMPLSRKLRVFGKTLLALRRRNVPERNGTS